MEITERLVFRDVEFLDHVSQLAIKLHKEENISKISKILTEKGFSVQEYALKTQIKRTIKRSSTSFIIS